MHLVTYLTYMYQPLGLIVSLIGESMDLIIKNAFRQ